MQPRSIWIISDDSHRTGQSIQLAKHLGKVVQTITAFDISRHGAQKFLGDVPPNFIIGAGEQTVDFLLAAKAHFGKQTFVISILDPRKERATFDAIIVPSYEPHPTGDNVITTTGLMNFISPEILAEALEDFHNDRHPELKAAHLPSPRYAVIIGGRHVGGNISSHAAEKLAAQLNTLDGSLMISTSKRTEDATAKTLREAITLPHFFYNYKHDESIRNPYRAMLALADAIIVSGDSLRMCSEACSTGKPVFIYMPKHDFSPYDALHEELYKKGCAKPFAALHSQKDFYTPKTLHEAKRVANKIKQLLL